MPVTTELDRLLDPAITKLNSAETCGLVPNAREIDEKLGSEETGWLLASPRTRRPAAKPEAPPTLPRGRERDT
jgi:hypothetical protein